MNGKGTLKLWGCIVLVLGLAIASVQGAQTTESNASISSERVLARLTLEINQLKVEVLQMRIEMEQARFEALERELRSVEENLHSLTTEEQTLKQEVEDLQRRLLNPTLSPEQ